jgi:hypothetical protein
MEDDMNLNVLLQVVELGLAEIVPIEGLIARLKNIFTLNPSATVNIQNLSSDALQADADTLKMIADWQKAHGLAVTVDPTAPPKTS